MKAEYGTVRRPNLCILCHNHIGYSQTFVRAHMERLPGTVHVLHKEPFGFRQGHDAFYLETLVRRTVGVALRWILRSRKRFFETRLLKRFLQKNKISAVLAEFGQHGVAAMDACREGGVPLIVHFHGYDVYDSCILKKKDGGVRYPELFQSADALIVVSRDMEYRLLELGAPQHKLHYNPCGADANLFQEADPGNVPPIFVTTGRFIEKKAPNLTLIAFKRVLEQCPDARLRMIGDGPLWKCCQKLSRSLGIQDSVEFLGPRSHTEVARIMQQARAFVQHSVTTNRGDSEGTPVAVLEAGITGLPVVATRHGGIKDVVLDGETGILVDEGDVEGMVQGMLRLARDPDLAGRLGRAAHDRIHTEFSMEKSLRKLWGIIEGVIQASSDLQDSVSPYPLPRPGSAEEKRAELNLPKVTFGVIVLNGEPFTRYCLRAIYPFANEIIVVEGACEAAATIATPEGHSTDGTLDVLTRFKKEEDPEDKVQIVTKEGFWSEKEEMSQAYAERASGDYLWQVDVDEFYQPEDMQRVLEILREDRRITAVAFKAITFWGSFDYTVDGFQFRQGWCRTYHRLFQWRPGYRYVNHRPPTVTNAEGVDLWKMKSVDGNGIMKKIVIHHYSLVFPKQVEDKCVFYSEASKWWGFDRSKAREWFQASFLKLNNPFRVYHLYDYPHWLERFRGVHPPQIVKMQEDIRSGSIREQTRSSDDIERVLESSLYQTGKLFLRLLFLVPRNGFLRWGVRVFLRWTDRICSQKRVAVFLGAKEK